MKEVKDKSYQGNSPVLHVGQHFAKGVGLTLYIPFVKGIISSLTRCHIILTIILGSAKFYGGIANSVRAAAHYVDPTYNKSPKVDGVKSGAIEVM